VSAAQCDALITRYAELVVHDKMPAAPAEVVQEAQKRVREEAAGDENFRGIELINRQFHDALAKLGVRPIPAAGEPFDPHLHQAVEVVDTSEAADDTVLEELQRGYRLKDRLLRPAMVRVARNPNK